MAVVTAVTAQNAYGVTGVHPVPPEVVVGQLEAVLAQVSPRAVKTGMLWSAATARAASAALAGVRAPIVVDPVLTATAGGAPLAEADLAGALVERLAPLATLVTPNLDEGAVLLGREIAPGEEAEAAAALRRLLRTDVLLKGGHARGPLSVDHLATGAGVQAFSKPRVPTPHGHGSGCALAASLAVRLGRGDPLADAVAGATAYVVRALEAAEPLGRGRGPVRHDVPVS
jgi:hydroxymethylpyrimidine/phosphomethylpyrimidine kinase